MGDHVYWDIDHFDTLSVCRKIFGQDCDVPLYTLHRVRTFRERGIFSDLAIFSTPLAALARVPVCCVAPPKSSGLTRSNLEIRF